MTDPADLTPEERHDLELMAHWADNQGHRRGAAVLLRDYGVQPRAASGLGSIQTGMA